MGPFWEKCEPSDSEENTLGAMGQGEYVDNVAGDFQ